MERKQAFVSLAGRKRQRTLELERIRIDFLRELEHQKKQKLENVQAQITKITLIDDEHTDFAENVKEISW